MAKGELGEVEVAKLQSLAKSRYWSEENAQVAIEAFRGSGLTKVAFHQATGITARRLQWWSRRRTAPSEEEIEFVPVPVTTTETCSGAEMEIAIGEARIRVGPRFDAEALRRLLAVITEPAC